ncbi:hypothetical protein H6504_05040 [Candidatus Woesearchaeota archaeon]|nr:hypothetical protein [Candidatus Woesearchaeota archaeon]
MKDKISITVEQSILADIDALAKAKKINRSKIIESILEKEMHKTPALILTVGQDTIDGKELCLHTYKGAPLIDAQIAYLHDNGIHDIHVHTDSSNIMNYISKHHPDVNLIYTASKTGNGGALKDCARKLQRPFIFMYGNILPSTRLASLETFMRKDASDLVMVLRSMKNPSKYGSAVMQGTQILKFKEKDKDASTHLIFTGLGMIEPECVKNLDDSGKLELQLDDIKRKHGFIDESNWRSFKTAKDFLD